MHVFMTAKLAAVCPDCAPPWLRLGGLCQLVWIPMLMHSLDFPVAGRQPAGQAPDPVADSGEHRSIATTVPAMNAYAAYAARVHAEAVTSTALCCHGTKALHSMLTMLLHRINT